MAVTERNGEFGTYYAGSLNDSYKEVNAKYIYKYLSAHQWTLNAIAALLGNIEVECGLNPGTVEKLGSGFGLIQWTPGSIHKNWCVANGYDDATSMDANLAHIVSEAKNNTSWYKKESYTESYSEFSESTKDPYYLACVFAWNRERSGVVLYGFHTNYHSRYCYPSAAFEIACRQCYLEKYGAAATAVQAEANRESLRNKRGSLATKWYNYLITSTFDSLAAKTTSELAELALFKNSYWINKKYGGLNIFEASVDDAESTASGGYNAAYDKQVLDCGSSLPNCTAWVWGRVYQIIGKAPLTFAGNAGAWYDCFSQETLRASGYSKSETTPALGAIMCWKDERPSSAGLNWGHVAVVEAIHEDGTVSFSESGYQVWSAWRNTGYLNIRKRCRPTDVYKNYTFKGYIHIPHAASYAVLPEIDAFNMLSAAATSATFELSIKSNGSVISGAYYTLNDSITGQLEVTDRLHKFTINNLVPNTEYNVMVTLEASGETINSIVIKFITKQDYPGHVQNIKLLTNGKNSRLSTFDVAITEPEYWGYWQRTNNPYGYRVFIIADYNLIKFFDSMPSASFSIMPEDYGVADKSNFQVGISTWVTDNSGEKIFALPGELFPTCSNSICLKDKSDMSDNCFMITDGYANRLQCFIKDTASAAFKPLNTFKL